MKILQIHTLKQQFCFFLYLHINIKLIHNLLQLLKYTP